MARLRTFLRLLDCTLAEIQGKSRGSSTVVGLSLMMLLLRSRPGRLHCRTGLVSVVGLDSVFGIQGASTISEVVFGGLLQVSVSNYELVNGSAFNVYFLWQNGNGRLFTVRCGQFSALL